MKNNVLVILACFTMLIFICACGNKSTECKLENEITIGSVQQSEDIVTIGRQALMFPPENQLQLDTNIAVYNY